MYICIVDAVPRYFKPTVGDEQKKKQLEDWQKHLKETLKMVDQLCQQGDEHSLLCASFRVLVLTLTLLNIACNHSCSSHHMLQSEQ